MIVCVTGAGGFIGAHLAKRLKQQGAHVVACDRKHNEHMAEADFCDEFKLLDLRVKENCEKAVQGCVHVYHLAAEMGGIGYISSNHAEIMFSNTVMSCHMLHAAKGAGVKRFFFSSSACVYPEYLQNDTNLELGLQEKDAWPAQPQDAYGLEKLATEELCMHYARDYGMVTRIARFHNIYGPRGTWTGGREKAPAAFCRKVAAASPGDAIEIWGDGEQTRSFTYIDDCVEGILRIMNSDISTPVNLGSDTMVSVNELAGIILDIAGKQGTVTLSYVPNAPQGVRGRNSNNTFVKTRLGWEPKISLQEGLRETYVWIKSQVDQSCVDAKSMLTSSLPRT